MEGGLARHHNGAVYESHFHLREAPFSIAPDPAYLYLSARHQEALGHLLYGTGRYGGFVQLTGEVGTGKTTVVRALLEQRLEQVQLVLIHNPRQSELEFVQNLCDGLGIAVPGPSDRLKSRIDALNQYLLQRHAQGWRTVLIVDEAQQLLPEVLEQLRLLTNLETAKEKLLRIMLVGQPELIDLLARRELRQLAQRITARHHLTPLDAGETAEYVQHRLQVAGGARDLFTPAALRAVHRQSGGLPRLINVICDRALLGAYAQGRSTVDRPLVLAAAQQTRGESAPASRASRPARQVPLAAALGLALAAGALGASGFLIGQRSRPPPPPAVAIATETATPSQPETLQAAVPSTMPAAVPAALPEPQDLPLLADAALYDRPEAALPALAALWPTAGSAAGDCASLRERRLECLGGIASLEQLRALDLPALIRLRDGGGYALLRQLAEDQAILVTPAGPRRLPIGSLSARWDGEYLLLWPRGSDELRIGPSNRGASVAWLRQRLSAVLGQPLAGVPAEWDPELELTLKRFQQARGLKPDGVAGARTLAALSAREGAPSLRPSAP